MARSFKEEQEDESAAAAVPLHETARNGKTAGATTTAAGQQGGSWLTRKVPFLRSRRGKVITVIVILLIIGGGLAGLAALPKNHHDGGADGGGDGTAADAITSDEHFYGESPAVYPSPSMAGTGTWAEAFKKAQTLVSSMTLAEKLKLTSGTAVSRNGCSGVIPAIGRVNFTGLCLSDAGNGLRNTDFVSSWPSGIHVGASWNKALARERGEGMGGEFRTKGVNVLLGPVVGPVGRVVLSGRNWEGFSVDPYLTGSLAFETITAIQGVGVITSTKHFIGNEQETNRNPFGDVESVSSNIDDRTMHELYLWPFQDAVHAGTGNIMCSYNRVNNSYGCANSKILNGLLKSELGFQGFVVSDWLAQHAGVATALAGMDMTMPGIGLWGPKLTEAVANGSVPESRIDDMALRTMAAWYQMGQNKDFPKPGIGMPDDMNKPHTIVDARNSTFRSTLLDGAVEGHVLVKNTNNALPLKEPKLLSLFGYSAKNPDQNQPGGLLSPWTFGVSSSNFTEFTAGFFNGGTYSTGTDPLAVNGTIYSGGGSGATSQSLTVSPFDAMVAQAYDDGTALFWDFVAGEPNVNPMSDACIVFGNAYATEGADRPGTQDAYTDNLIKHVADQCANTIVVLHNAGIRLVDGFVDHPNVTALIFAHLPGEASGKALVSILYGKANPSGKLPYTIAKKESEYPVVGPDLPTGKYKRFPQSNFTEGVFIDYRHFDARNITPRYEFGFGLSYSTFSYGNLTVQKSEMTEFAQFPSGEIVEGGQKDLWDVLVTVSADVTNTGEVDGAEVAQLYVQLPSSSSAEGLTPVRQLRGFEKPFINATQTARVEFQLTRRDLSIWDVERQSWSLERGEYGVFVGGSSRDLPLVGKVTV
ncbi:beta-glucosidase [Apodospora peruviana]|uniref:beta-glucosidase n=1 Tax=Apodospora peruviana TaxID=516989 RepID=A0AAE0IJS5_9PEZI|nr:beta-glucosidase [Apodospora peruviana]